MERLIYIPADHLYLIFSYLVASPDAKFENDGEFERLVNGSIDFDASEYKKIPSVTGVLSAVEEDGVKFVDFSAVPEDILEAARRRGTFVHDMIDAFEAGDLDETRIPKEFVGYLDSYKKWKAASKLTTEASEIAGAALFGDFKDPALSMMIAGRIDRVAKKNATGKFGVVDFKTGSPDGIAAKIQVAEYTRIGGVILGEKLEWGTVVGLKADGSFKEVEVDVPKYLAVGDKIAAKICDPTLTIDLPAIAKDAARIPEELEDDLAELEEQAAALKAKIEAKRAEIILALGGPSGVGNRFSVYQSKPTFGVDGDKLKEIAPDLAAKYERATVELPAGAWRIIAEQVEDFLDPSEYTVETKTDPKVLDILSPIDAAKVRITVRKASVAFKPKKSKKGGE